MGRRPKNKNLLIPKEKIVPPTLLRGMKDILPQEQSYWDVIIKKGEQIVRDYGFKKIDTPVLESLSLFKKTTGGTTDIVEKEIYSFLDKEKSEIALKPEATPGIVRAYLEHGMFNLSQPVKLYTISPLFRRERPQAGRLREHHQFNLEAIGDKDPVIEAQLMLIAYKLFQDLEIDIVIKLNSIGCQECRPQYKEALFAYLKSKKNSLCSDCKKRLTKNPLRILDCKEERCKKLVADAPQIVDWLDEECKVHFTKVLEYADELEIPYILDSYLVRGLDYYTKTVFEIWPNIGGKDAPRQSAFGGGGRYDNLILQLSGKEISACGMGIGIERLVLQMKDNKFELPKKESPEIFVAQLGEKSRMKAIALFESLRLKGYKVAENFSKGGLRAQLEIANKGGVKFTLILGQKEAMDGTILIRDMSSGIQEIVDFSKIDKILKKKLKK